MTRQSLEAYAPSHPSASQDIDTAGDDLVLLGVRSGAIMADDMGTFRVDIEIENPARPGEKRLLEAVPVDTGAELSWVPAPVLESLGVEHNNQWRFRQADGFVLERWTGTVVILSRADERATRSSSGSPEISPCWDRGRWRGSTSGWSRSPRNWWTPARHRPPPRDTAAGRSARRAPGRLAQGLRNETGGSS